jgi:hypothetical protein
VCEPCIAAACKVIIDEISIAFFFIYSFSVSSSYKSNFACRETLVQRPEFCLVVHRVAKSCQGMYIDKQNIVCIAKIFQRWNTGSYKNFQCIEYCKGFFRHCSRYGLVCSFVRNLNCTGEELICKPNHCQVSSHNILFKSSNARHA